MKTLDRYLCSLFLKNLMTALLSLVSLFLFQALLSDLYDHSFSAQQVIFYNLLSIPQFFVQMAPPAVLLATVLTLSGLGRTNELTAFYSIGFSLKRIVLLIICLVGILSSLVLFLEDRVLPPMFKKRTTYYWRDMQKRPDFYMDLKQDKIWYRSKNLIYNLQRFDAKTQNIIGMSVYTFDGDFNLLQAVDAEKAEYSSSGWKLLNGTVTEFSPDDPFPLTQKFKEKSLMIAETPKDFQEIDKEVDGLRLKELRKYIQRISEAGGDTKGYQVNFWSRISLSFIPIVMCFLGIPFSVASRREGSLAKDLGLCLVLTFFYWLFHSIGLSLGTNGAVPPIAAAWMPSVIFTGVAAVLIVRKRV